MVADQLPVCLKPAIGNNNGTGVMVSPLDLDPDNASVVRQQFAHADTTPKTAAAFFKFLGERFQKQVGSAVLPVEPGSHFSTRHHHGHSP